MSAALSPTADVARGLARLPLATLYLTERCNSRCVSCDYWRNGHVHMDLAAVARLLPQLRVLQTEAVLISGGEPLLNRQWDEIADLLRGSGLKLWLLTSGLSLAKHAQRVAERFDAVTVSLDGATAETYARIRGVNALEKVRAGIGAAAAAGVPVTVRVTVQRANYRELPALVDLARSRGATQISFLAIDIANPHAFARREGFNADLALETHDLPHFARVLDALELEYAGDFHSGFIAETPAKLRRLWHYFAAVRGQGEYPQVRCNAPDFSAVIDAHGQVHPCFFIPGPARAGVADSLIEALKADAMTALRTDIRAGRRPECKTCVCTMWRDSATPAAERLLPRTVAAKAELHR